MNLSDVNNSFDQNMLERINPVFNTAKMTLFQLAAAGDTDAALISERLDLTMEQTQGEVAEDELINNCIVLETRYRTMGMMAERSGCPVKVDLPCGYTPRAIEFARKGLRFVGLDLPAAINEAGPVISSLIEEDKRDLVKFEAVDATNYASLKKVFDGIEGEVCITTEGLMMYFTDSEAGECCDNIRRILCQHGGCWILADAETVIQYILTTKAVFGDRFMEIMMKGKKRAEERSDVDVVSRTLVVNPSDPAKNIGEAMMFLARHGLKAERLIVADYAPQLKSLDKVTDEQAQQIKEAMKQYAFWKITPIEEMKLDAKEAKASNFELTAEVAGDVLTLHPQGRLDTLSSPGLLQFYEKTASSFPIEKIRVDCSGLDYISSAGLRVLLIMSKDKEGEVTVTDINDDVREIMEQTGFDNIIEIE